MTDSDDGRWVPAAPQWRFIRGGYDDLVAVAADWPTTTATPPQIAEMLATGRSMFSHTWFVYELGHPTVMWSLITVEAALRHRLHRFDKNHHLNDLITAATKDERLLSSQFEERLHAARQLRNRMVHGAPLAAFSPGMLAGFLTATHDLVAELFPDKD